MECLRSQIICRDLKLTNVFVVNNGVLCSGVGFWNQWFWDTMRGRNDKDIEHDPECGNDKQHLNTITHNIRDCFRSWSLFNEIWCVWLWDIDCFTWEPETSWLWDSEHWSQRFVGWHNITRNLTITLNQKYLIQLNITFHCLFDDSHSYHSFPMLYENILHSWLIFHLFVFESRYLLFLSSSPSCQSFQQSKTITVNDAFVSNWHINHPKQQVASVMTVVPLSCFSTTMNLQNHPSLAVIIIQTLSRLVQSRLFMWLDDLSKLSNDCVEIILHECPFLTRPEKEDCLSIICEYRHIPQLQQTLPKNVLQNHNLVFSINNNPSNRPNNVTIHHPLTDSSHHSHHHNKTQLVIFPLWVLHCLKYPPSNSRLYSFNNSSEKWNWIIPSKTHATIFIIPFISHTLCGTLKHGGFPQTFQIMQLCPSCGSAWIMLSYPKGHLKIILCANTVKVSHPWITSMCLIKHIQHNTTIPPSQWLIYRCSWRLKDNEKIHQVFAEFVSCLINMMVTSHITSSSHPHSSSLVISVSTIKSLSLIVQTKYGTPKYHPPIWLIHPHILYWMCL